MVCLGVILLSTVSLVIYIYLKWPYGYWKEQGIETADSLIPVFGHTLWILCFGESLSDICIRLYKNSTKSMIGIFHLNTPVLVVRELELVKTILVKKFNSFRQNLIRLDPHRDPFTAAHPFFAVDDNWKVYHDRIVKGMSSKKLKIMFEAIQRVSLKFEKLLEQVEGEVDLKKLFLPFTSEIVCNVGFGIEYNHTYATISGKIFENNWINEFKLLLNFFFPSMFDFLQLTFETEEIRNYFGTIAKHIVSNGKDDNFVRMTMEALGQINHEVATSLISAFYIDASATVAKVISMVLFRLSKNPAIQEKLRIEIYTALEKNNGELSYETLNDIKYLQQVINETMRLHPALEIHTKVCTETTTLCGSDGQTCTLQPGNIVVLPVSNLHTDLKYWNDPETFDPDNFADDKKDKLIPLAFLPFGESPRQCPGMRFGTIEIKAALITILRRYKLISSEKTKLPLQMDNRSILRSVRGGLWANLRRIEMQT